MGEEAAIDAESGRRLVLDQRDVPSVFTRFDYGRIASADLPAGVRSDPARFGRQSGWKARYRRGGTAETAGPLVIESLVDVFESSDGAKEDVAALRSELENPAQPVVTPTTMLPDPDLGDEAVAWSATVPAQPRDTVFFTVAWRHENATASVSVNGFEGLLDLETAVALARKQQARLESAS
jgi:hypothetical protein